jgi:hypothetical protein
MFAKKAAAAIAAAWLSLGLPALAQSPDQLVERYTSLAGSPTNARALVAGLRDGSEIKLELGGKTTTIDPLTPKMGYGNIDNALALAEASLHKQSIFNPTLEQLKSSLTSVLQMRADGKGWGEIANSMGFKLGELKRAEAAQARPSRDEGRPYKPQRPEKPERPMKPERPDRPNK